MRNPAFARSTGGHEPSAVHRLAASPHGVRANSKYNVLLKCVKG
ncbi:MAG: hypothetical protein ACLUE1_01445 [Adlercreutzia equolifaciens]